jgi:glycosyltransferase involved in cell wall biosynthesis
MVRDSKLDHISVCICSYKRPEMLTRALDGVACQVTASAFSFEVVVVDNDSRRSAEDTVRRFQSTNELKIIYDCEPEQNIALARNRAIQNAKGNFIAFMDDDEFPISTWLLELYKACTKYGADGVLGPVKPYFDQVPPAWIVKGRFCEREEHPTGTVLHWGNTRTGNVLVDIKLFNESRFDAKFGKTGGEDIEFFKKAMEQGRMFVWCNEAVAHETVPPERWKEAFYFRKFLRIGGLTGEKVRNWPFAYRNFLKAISAFIWYTAQLPFSFVFGKHVYMKYLMKVVYYIGWISGFCGFVVVRHRDD